MNTLGLALLALGLGDWVAGGLGGMPDRGRRAAWGVLTVFLVSLGGSSLFIKGDAQVWFVGLTCLTAAAWLGSRLVRATGGSEAVSGETPASEARRAALALGVLSGFCAICLLFSASWEEPLGAGVRDWLSKLPLFSFEASGTPRVFLGIGASIFLVATSNAIVRTALAVAGTSVDRSDSRLHAGRMIGAIERLLIFGLAISGHPTAAALIVSAKSVLRFPQISSAARREEEAGARSGGKPAAVDLATEYFLLGSLVSWALALAAAALMRAG